MAASGWTKQTKIIMNCHECGIEFLARQKNTKFCSTVCRYRAYDKRRTEEQKAKRYARMRLWGTENWERKRNYMIKRSYGITPEQYNEMLVRQDYKCAICDKHEEEFGRKLGVDHSHSSGEIRGLLCLKCNKDIIGHHEDPMIYEKAAHYLRTGHTGLYVPEKMIKPKRPNRKKRK